ncbi:hypothetical protein [Motilimonas pumila]|uniref:Uncharacterized protein n=1 Tax=Motilimonas pumila TaxID=2303987 RepID=A0A418YE69_9GAMM|nr:hypothetical protein [Motilimonas pumila]RJG47451.1 hypothetical protein D1Z90_11100 [Motilimonas pumila]
MGRGSVALPISWLDSVTILYPNGNLSAPANTSTWVKNKEFEYDLYLNGKWSFDGKIITTGIEHIEVVAKNAALESDLATIRHRLNQPEMLHHQDESLVLNDALLTTKDKEGEITSCRRVLSAARLRDAS